MVDQNHIIVLIGYTDVLNMTHQSSNLWLIIPIIISWFEVQNLNPFLFHQADKENWLDFFVIAVIAKLKMVELNQCSPELDGPNSWPIRSLKSPLDPDSNFIFIAFKWADVRWSGQSETPLFESESNWNLGSLYFSWTEKSCDLVTGGQQNQIFIGRSIHSTFIHSISFDSK